MSSGRHAAARGGNAEHTFYAAYPLRGSLGVVMATSGGGAMNLVHALAEARASRVPLLALVGEPPTELQGAGAFQDTSGKGGAVDAAAVLEAAAGFCLRVRNAEEALRVFDRALAHARAAGFACAMRVGESSASANGVRAVLGIERLGTGRERSRRMTILCGTDFSEASQRALKVAARFAARLQTPLHLVHAMHPPRESVGDAEYIARTTQLDRAADVARELGAEVKTHLESGPPDETLLRLAKTVQATQIVVGALGNRVPGTWQIGSHAERLAQTSHVPVLVVRNDEPFTSWLLGQRPLRVMLGADFSRSADEAARRIDGLRRLSPCEVTAVHLYWPPQEFARLGLSGVRSYLDPEPEVTRTLVRELTQRFAPEGDPKLLTVQVEPNLGRLGDRLAALAQQREADLLVVGSHARGTLGRVREGSVSHWALHEARTSVLCVPAPIDLREKQIPRVRDVLVATDFSPAGNAAVCMAYALAERGGTVHLVHVVPARNTDRMTAHDVFDLEQSGKPDPRRDSGHSALAEVVPAGNRDRITRFYTLESNEPGAAICAAAARLDAELICMGRRGRSNLSEVLLGSVSRHVLSNAQCPVLLAQAPRE